MTHTVIAKTIITAEHAMLRQAENANFDVEFELNDAPFLTAQQLETVDGFYQFLAARMQIPGRRRKALVVH